MNTTLDTATSTKLATTLSYLGAGEEAIADMQRRLDMLTGADHRIMVGPIETDDHGMPRCSLKFDCSEYAPPVEGEPDPQAVKDLRKILSGINFDGCIGWDKIALLTQS